jgi:hypothetical protein
MTNDDLAAFATRDRSGLVDAKAAHWRRRKVSAGPSEGLRIADELRRLVQSLRPDWPEQTHRDADLATHVRVGAMLRRVRTLSSR